MGSHPGDVAGCEIMMGYRFNPPPNWPAPPPGWVPTPGWKPLPEWPDPPVGWQLWVEDEAIGPAPASRVQASVPTRSGPKHARPTAPATEAPVTVTPSAAPTVVVTASGTLPTVPASTRREEREKVGIFGAHKRAEALLQENAGLADAHDALAAENQRLCQQVTALLGMDTQELAAEANRVRDQVQADVEQARADLANLGLSRDSGPDLII